MLKDAVILIPTSTPWEWSADYVRQTATRMSRQNRVYCFVWAEVKSVKELLAGRDRMNPVERLREGLTFYQGVHWLPWQRFRLVRIWNLWINALILKLIILTDTRSGGWKKSIYWVFDPQFYPLNRVFGLRQVLYDCVDYYVGGLKGEEKRRVAEVERKLLREADVVTVNSRVLWRHCKRYRKEVTLVPQGFDVEVFSSYRRKKKRWFGSKPVIGFVGGINNRLDYYLLLELVQRNPLWTFVLWGPVQGDDARVAENLARLREMENVRFGQSRREEIPEVIAAFDVGMIPYDMTQPFNQKCFPMKVFEYFYMGKSVVSAPIEELRRYPGHVTVVDGAAEWRAAIESELGGDVRLDMRKRRRKLALTQTWEKKLTYMGDLLG